MAPRVSYPNDPRPNGRLFLSVTIRASLGSKRSSENLEFFDMYGIGYLNELSLEMLTTNDYKIGRNSRRKNQICCPKPKRVGLRVTVVKEDDRFAHLWLKVLNGAARKPPYRRKH